MASIHHIRGALLEEVVLALLRASGYRTVTTHAGDDCLHQHSAGIAVKGRGCIHQIDAIADHVVGHAFSNPQRLLVEAKNYSDGRTVGLDVVRNGVGVLRDVSEFIPVASSGHQDRRRYHYQYAIFASSRFSREAQDYAFAQDIYLFQLSAASALSDTLMAIDAFAARLPIDARNNVEGVNVASLRLQLRTALQPELPTDEAWGTSYGISQIVEATRLVGGTVVASIARTFPVLLTPDSPNVLSNLADGADVVLHIEHGNQRQWTISRGDQRLFVFDVPEELFRKYVVADAFDPQRALMVKEQYFREIQFVHTLGNRTRLVTLRLDGNWLRSARAALGFLSE